MEHRTEARKRKRRSMQKFGCGISSPAHKRAAGIKKRYLRSHRQGGTQPWRRTLRDRDSNHTHFRKESLPERKWRQKIPLLQLHKALLKQHEAKSLLRPAPQALEEFTGVPRNTTESNWGVPRLRLLPNRRATANAPVHLPGILLFLIFKDLHLPEQCFEWLISWGTRRKNSLFCVLMMPRDAVLQVYRF